MRIDRLLVACLCSVACDGGHIGPATPPQPKRVCATTVSGLLASNAVGCVVSAGPNPDGRSGTIIFSAFSGDPSPVVPTDYVEIYAQAKTQGPPSAGTYTSGFCMVFDSSTNRLWDSGSPGTFSVTLTSLGDPSASDTSSTHGSLTCTAIANGDSTAQPVNVTSTF
jgi:hypothetical protein